MVHTGNKSGGVVAMDISEFANLGLSLEYAEARPTAVQLEITSVGDSTSPRTTNLFCKEPTHATKP
jgi:hypothetical protein